MAAFNIQQPVSLHDEAIPLPLHLVRSKTIRPPPILPSSYITPKKDAKKKRRTDIKAPPPIKRKSSNVADLCSKEITELSIKDKALTDQMCRAPFQSPLAKEIVDLITPLKKPVMVVIDGVEIDANDIFYYDLTGEDSDSDSTVSNLATQTQLD